MANTKTQPRDNDVKTTEKLIRLIGIFSVYVVLLAILYCTLPPLKADEYEKVMKIPKSLSQVRVTAQVLSRYTSNYYYRVAFMVWALYLFLQTFSVPGTIFLNVLCGAVFGLTTAFIMTVAAGTLGASSAYFMSSLLGFKSVVEKFVPTKLQFFRDQISSHKENLFFYLLFLRISPMLPNWFINIASPVLNIPFSYFFLATLIGISPQTFIAVNTGVYINELVEEEGGNPLLNYKTISLLFAIATMALLPIFLKRYFVKSKVE
ncbi:SNARE associated Golgi protein [Acrasis kona]|uniref:SNARE associated Golgi protein n=1 Tax=Acrasis kona TaxID=1008807 RepID=A0AAW2YI02_9EUKA